VAVEGVETNDSQNTFERNLAIMVAAFIIFAAIIFSL